MPMTDMRLSAMTAALSEELIGLTQANEDPEWNRCRDKS